MDTSLTNSTQIVAWWGAIVATFVLVWDAYKYFSNGAKIKSRVYLNIDYDDSKLIPEKTVGNVASKKYEQYCHIELINIGNMPTTIMEIRATHKPIKTCKLIRGAFGMAFTEHFGNKLPYVLPPGEVWSCRIGMENYMGILKQNTPEIHVSLSHLSKPLVITASKATNKLLKRDSAKSAEPLS